MNMFVTLIASAFICGCVGLLLIGVSGFAELFRKQPDTVVHNHGKLSDEELNHVYVSIRSRVMADIRSARAVR